MVRKSAVVLVGLSMLGACATREHDLSSEKRGAKGPAHHFFPPAPAAPRLQFLMAFSDGESIGKPVEERKSFAQWVVGEEKRKAATSTEFVSPYGIALHDGRVYLCDVAAGRVHVVDLRTRQYRRLEAPGRIRQPLTVAIDSDGTKYVCDNGVGMVLIFDAEDRFIGEFGEGAGWNPVHLAIRGNELFVSDTMAGQIHVWSKQGKRLRRIGEKGEGLDQLDYPTNLAFGPDGRLYVVDGMLQAVKIFDPEGGHFLGLIGGPGNRVGSFARPKGIAISEDGVIYVADAQWNTIQMFNLQGQILMDFGEPGSNPWNLGIPATIALDRKHIEVFRRYLAPNFEPEYLVFVVNQFGTHKVGVFAFGRDRSLPASAYEVDEAAVEAEREKLREEARKRREAKNR